MSLINFPIVGIPHKGEATMLEQFEQHMNRRKLADNTIRLRLFYLKRFEEDNPALAQVTTEDIEDYLESISHLSQNSQQSIIASLKVFYKWAAHTHQVAEDPTYYIPNVRIIRKQGRIASELSIYSALYEGTRSQQAMVRLGAECGLRVSEIAALHRSSRNEDWLTIVGKGGRQRTVHIGSELAEILDSIQRRGIRRGYYFPGGTNGHLHQSTVWRHIRAVLGSNPHSLRHRAGTTVFNEGGKNIRMTQEFLGHSSPATTAIYVHVGMDELRQAGEAARFKLLGNAA